MESSGRVFANNFWRLPILKVGKVRCWVVVVGLTYLDISLRELLTTFLTVPDLILFPVTGITKSTNNHASIREAVGNKDRFSVVTMDDCKGETFDNVVFCAPPSGFEDYGGAVEDAVTNVWSGLEKGGAFVFTSSGGM